MKPLLTLAAAWRELPRVLPLMRNGAVPIAAKIAAIVAAVFIISPFDLLGDIPVLGLVDDVALLAVVVHLFVWFSERAIARAPVVVHNVTPQPPYRGAGITTR